MAQCHPNLASGCERGLRPCCYLIITVIVVLSIIGIVISVLVLPVRHPTFKVESVNITDLKFNTTVLNTTISFGLVVGNRNRRVGLCYDDMYLNLSSSNQTLGEETISGFYQGHNETKMINAYVRYEGSVMEGTIWNANRSRFPLEVSVNTEVRIKMAFITSIRFQVEVLCDLKVDLTKLETPIHRDCELLRTTWW